MKSVTVMAICLMGILYSATAQDLNQRYTDKKDKEHLIGKCDRNALTAAPFAEWYKKYYDAYELDKTLLKHSEGKLEDVKIEIFMGTWCGDSKRGVPEFYKVLDELGVEASQVTLVNLYNMDSVYKRSPNHEEQGKLIHRVPTFIFYKKDKEIGRIVETPVTSFEMDMAQLLNGLPTAPNYKAVQDIAKIFEEEGVPTDRKELLKIANRIYKGAKGYRALNTYGYVLLSNNEIEKAIATFTINTMIFSKMPNVWDSLAEAHEKNGDTKKALSLYEYVLELNPNSKNAIKKVAELTTNN
jgi:tetratricopeptide (TPR) repeat protein